MHCATPDVMFQKGQKDTAAASRINSAQPHVLAAQACNAARRPCDPSNRLLNMHAAVANAASLAAAKVAGEEAAAQVPSAGQPGAPVPAQSQKGDNRGAWVEQL
jgi:hypothetical protein